MKGCTITIFRMFCASDCMTILIIVKSNQSWGCHCRWCFMRMDVSWFFLIVWIIHLENFYFTYNMFNSYLVYWFYWHDTGDKGNKWASWEPEISRAIHFDFICKNIRQITFCRSVESQLLRKDINPEIRDSIQGQLRLVFYSFISLNCYLFIAGSLESA